MQYVAALNTYNFRIRSAFYAVHFQQKSRFFDFIKNMTT